MIELDQIEKSFGAQPVFEPVSLRLNDGERVGLAGTIRVGRGQRVGYLPQEMVFGADRTVLQAVHRDEYAEHEAKRVLAGLGFGEEDYDRSMLSYSGGYRMRIALAHLLLSAPDILLLDEPTNHLDAPAKTWLEGFLTRSEMTLLIVSHDTDFLDLMVTRVWEVYNRGIRVFQGNYKRYTELRQARQEQLEKAAKAQELELARGRRFVERFRAKASKAKQAQSKLKQLEKLQRIELERDPRRIRFHFPQPPRSGQVVLRLDAVAKSYGDNSVYRRLDFAVERGQRVALLGENGSGKSTLLKILSGILPIDGGERLVGHGVPLHYFAQHQAEVLEGDCTTLESLRETSPDGDDLWLRKVAGAFLFSGDDQFKKISVLSGGERSRVALARMLINPANVLLLDEPTNHLDPASVDVLTDALTDFQGTMVFISHDPVFLSRIANRVVEVAGGRVDYIGGDYEHYLWKKSREADAWEGEGRRPASAKNQSRKAPPVEMSPGQRRRGLAKDLQRNANRLLRVETEISSWEKRIQRQDQDLESEELYQDYQRWTALRDARNAWQLKLDSLINLWSSLCEENHRLTEELKAIDRGELPVAE
jgi:ATP-binding cassette subfamily F protein 3